MMSIQLHLLSLYVSVLIPILSEWICDEDLCCLDTAVCSQKLRNNFLKLLDQCNIINTDLERNDRFDYFKLWMLRRGLGLKKFYMKLVDPVTRQLLTTHKQSCYLEGGNHGALSELLRTTNVISNDVKLTGMNGTLLFLHFTKQYGKMLTDLAFWGPENYAESIALNCPNLTSVTIRDYRDLLPFIDICPCLQHIVSTNLTQLREKTLRQSYTCDLIRTSVVDESAVCLGEGKYFHLIGLILSKFEAANEQDCAILIPMVKNLTTLLVGKNSAIVEAAVQNCYFLTSLEVDKASHIAADVIDLITHSTRLVRLRLVDTVGKSVDPFLLCASRHCLQLESCIIRGFTISTAALSALFDNCTSLKLFQLDMYKHTDLCLKSRGVFNSERYGMSLLLNFSVPKSIEALVVSRFSGLKSLSIQNYSNDNQAHVNSLLQSLPDLTSLDINSQSSMQCNIDSAILSALKLKRLTMTSCVCFTNMIAVIADTCPDLTYLNLSLNRSITCEAIAPVLEKCTKLVELNLWNCSAITSSLFDMLQLPSLRMLVVAWTKITKKEVEHHMISSPHYKIVWE